MKKRIGILLVILLLICAGAQAAPELSGVFAGDAALVAGQEGWYFEFSATEGGRLALQLLSGETGEVVADLGAKQIEAGSGRIGWNGLLADGTRVPSGNYMLAVQLKNYWNEESTPSVLSLSIFDSAAQREENTLDLSALVLEDAAVWEETQPDAQETAQAPMQEAALQTGVPQAANFWEMNPDDYDLTNPEHQQAIWDVMMQPITVIDGDQTENVYITNEPGISPRPYKDNCAGELHGQSQGVRIVEDDADGDGYVKIEAYTNDGTKADSEYMESIAASKVQGYIKKSRLYEAKPSDKYALLVDKLRQKMYVFEAGRIIGEMAVSTGLNTKKQPYNETPAGEFLVVSWTGDFKAGGNTIGRFALRINGGTLLHEVLHDVGADGKTKLYDYYEPQLGQKASHGCVRVQRRKNAQGMNMQWLWDNLEKNTKVLIWEDKGRTMYMPELPDAATPLYRNPNGGSNYHLDQNCSGVKDKFLPLTGDFTYGDLDSDGFKKLTPCVYCDAPLKKGTLYERYKAAAEQIGAEITDEAKAMFGAE